MQRTVASKLISGLSASGASASVSGGSGITVSNGVVSVDNNVVATDAELATKLAEKVSTTDLTTQLATKASTTELATKVSASDNNLTFSGTTPKFSNNLTVANKVLLGNNSGFGIVCVPELNNLTDYSLLFDSHSTLLNKRNTGDGQVSIRLANNNKISVVDLAGDHTNCVVYITPTSVNGSGLTVLPSHVLSNETFQMMDGKNIVLPANSKITLDGTNVDKNTIASIATNTATIATLTPFQNIWRYDTRVFLGEADHLMWNDDQTIWLDTATNTTVKLPEGIYTCRITTLGGYNNGGMGASENLQLWVFTGSFTHLKGAQGGAVNDNDDAPEIVEDIAQWWHKNEITNVAGARAYIVRKMVGGFMETHFRFTGISNAVGSYINLRFEMKRLW
jgi:hypothetical protein